MKDIHPIIPNDLIMYKLKDIFTYGGLRDCIKETRKSLHLTDEKEVLFNQITWLASSHYELEFSLDTNISERVIFPVLANEKNGIEDARFVQFVDDNGKMRNRIETDKRQWLEIGAVILTGLMKYVFMDWLELRIFYIGVACLFWTIYIYKSYQDNKLILQHWGFRKNYFKNVFLFLMPFVMAIIAAIVWYGISNKTITLNWHLIPVFIFYPLWGIIQQFLIIALVAGNLQSLTTVKLRKYQIILLISVLFALVHYPSLPLMLFVFLMELLFTNAYFRWRNLWPLGLYHGWVASLLLFFVLGRDLWNELWIVF